MHIVEDTSIARAIMNEFLAYCVDIVLKSCPY